MNNTNNILLFIIIGILIAMFLYLLPENTMKNKLNKNKKEGFFNPSDNQERDVGNIFTDIVEKVKIYKVNEKNMNNIENKVDELINQLDIIDIKNKKYETNGELFKSNKL